MRYIINEETMAEIANAIRNKTGYDGVIKGSDIAAYIQDIRTSGAPVLEGLTITPTGQEFVMVPPYGVDGFDIVAVEGDEYLIPENIRIGVSIYGVEGLLNPGSRLDTSDATATADDILESATAYVDGVKVVGKHVCPNEAILSEIYITPTGDEIVKTPGEGVDGFEKVIVEGDKNLIPKNILAGVSIYGVNGEVAIQKSKQATPGLEAQNVKPDLGYTAISEVLVQGDSNLLPENILEGISIFGVKGTAKDEETLMGSFEKEKIQSKVTVTPGVKDIDVTPEKGFLGIKEVLVEGDGNLIPENILEGASIFGVKGVAVAAGGGGGGGNTTFIFEERR